MKMQFSLGLLLPLTISVSAISSQPLIKLNATDMEAIAEPLGESGIDPTLTCDATYDLTVDCKFNKFIIYSTKINTLTKYPYRHCQSLHHSGLYFYPYELYSCLKIDGTRVID